MALETFDALVVSAYGRGHWLASQMAKARMKVRLIDVSAQLGPWPLEDLEGPFGVVRLDRYEESFKERLNQDDAVLNQDFGWTFWLPEGPLEMRGPLSQFHFQQYGFPEAWTGAWSRGETPACKVNAETSFDSYWCLALSCQLASTHFYPPTESVRGGALPLTASFGLRQPTRAGFTANAKWLREQGVDVIEDAKLVDLVLRRRGFYGVEIAAKEWSGLTKGSFLLWNLTAAETAFISEGVGQKLYPKGDVEPDWAWLRYRLQVTPGPETEPLPLHTVILGDLYQPWTHDNLVVLAKTPSADRWDAWMRLPAGQRFNSEYLKTQGEHLIARLKSKMPTTALEVQTLPQETAYDAQTLGPAKQPVWAAGANPASARIQGKYLYFENIENRANHSTESEYDSQVRVRDEILKAWSLLQAKNKKKEVTA